MSKHNEIIKEVYSDYYQELEEFERENNIGKCEHCEEIRNRIQKIIEHE